TRLAHGLHALGVRKGDRVCVLLGNTAEYAVIHYALFKLGAILVPLNPSFNAPQVVAALNHLGAAWLVCGLESKLPRKPPRSNIPLLSAIVPDLQHGARQVQTEVVPSLRAVVGVDNSDGRVDMSAYGGLTPWADIAHGGVTGAV